jgi:hypothetical protein
MVLDEFDFVTFGSVDESEGAVGAFGGSVREGVTFGCGVLGEGFDVIHFEGEVSEVGAEGDGAAGGEATDFEEFLAIGRFEEDEFGSSGRAVAADFSQAKDFGVKPDGFFEIVDAVAGVKEFFDHVGGRWKMVMA